MNCFNCGGEIDSGRLCMKCRQSLARLRGNGHKGPMLHESHKSQRREQALCLAALASGRNYTEEEWEAECSAVERRSLP